MQSLAHQVQPPHPPDLKHTITVRTIDSEAEDEDFSGGDKAIRILVDGTKTEVEDRANHIMKAKPTEILIEEGDPVAEITNSEAEAKEEDVREALLVGKDRMTTL